MRQAIAGRPILVCVVERNLIAAEYLLALLNQESRIRALPLERMDRQAADHGEVVFLVDHWELALPLSECLRRLTALFPQAKILVLDRPQSQETIVRLLSLGIHGFLEHSQVSNRLVEAVLSAAEGRIYVAPDALAAYVQFAAGASRRAVAGSTVTTSREIEIIELVRRRLSNKEIAAILRIQESTVKFHLSNIFAKLQVTGRHDLVRQTEPTGGWSAILT